MEKSKKKPIKAYSYIRVSTAMQVEGFSVEAQRNKILKYAKDNGMVVVREYSDLGVSGKNIEKRPCFKQMLNDISNNKDGIDFILVFKLSRFGRNAADVVSSLQYIQDYGVNLVCIDDSIDSSKDSGKLMISVLSAVAEIERENINVQTMAGRKQKALEGGWNGGFAPYGYTLKEGKLYIEEDEAETIRTIFDMYVNEDFGAVGIANRLNALGVKKKVRHNGKLDTFSAHFIKKVIDNPVYKGYIAFGRRKTEKIDGKRNEYHVVKEANENNIIVSKGEHKAIIPEEFWERAHQKRMATGGKKEKLEKEHEYILSGLISCPYCGKHMYGVPSRKRKKNGEMAVYYAYACRQNNNATGHICPQPRQYSCKVIDDQVARIVIWQLNRTEVLDEMTKQAYREFDVEKLKKEIKESKDKIRNLDKKKVLIDKSIDELDFESVAYEMMFKDLIKKTEEIISKKLEYERIIKENEQKIENVKEREKQWNDSFNFLIRLLNNYGDYTDYEKKKLMQRLVKNIEIYPEKKAFGYLKSIEFAFPVFKSRLTDEQSTIYTIQDEYPGIIDGEGEFTDFDPDEGYVIPEPELDENGCAAVYPDEGDYFKEHGCLTSEDLLDEQSKVAMQYWEEHKDEYQKSFPPKESHDESVALLERKG